MTVVTLRGLASALGAAAPLTVGQIIAEPWAGREPYIRVDGADVEFPREVTVDILAGEPVPEFNLPPLAVPYRLRVTDVAGHQALERYVLIPDSDEPIDFGDLEQVNPDTFAPANDPTILDTVRSLLFVGVDQVVALGSKAEYDALPEPRNPRILYAYPTN